MVSAARPPDIHHRKLIKGATMSDFDAIADAYIDMWNETDTTARKARVEQLFAPGGCYTDPLADVTGHDQIDAMINAVQQQFPACTSPSSDLWTRITDRLDSVGLSARRGRVTDRRIRRTRTRRRRRVTLVLGFSTRCLRPESGLPPTAFVTKAVGGSWHHRCR